jgi:NAD+ synthase (glutamine-hydrolysing)
MAQLNPTVGDIAGNSALILQAAQQAQSNGADILLLPEMVVTGYPVEDLALRATFRRASQSAISELALTLPPQLVCIVGYLAESAQARPENRVAVIYGGKIALTYTKRHLPNYGVFDEFRHFVAGNESRVFRYKGVDIALAICEDIWHHGLAITEIAARRPGLLLVPNGSPFEIAKDDQRLALVSQRALDVNAPVAYVNLTGGQDDLIFDGDSLLVARDGRLLARSAQFVDQILYLEVHCEQGAGEPDLVIESSADESAEFKIDQELIAVPLSEPAQIWQALVVGLRDYVAKNKFKSVILGLSGGIDSAVTAAIAVDALGPDRVFGVALPSKYSSPHSLSDAQDSAERLGLSMRTVPIQPMVDSYLAALSLTGLAEENLQARVRGTTLMGISNQEGHLVLATGNKSELAVGYSTMYGDAVGGYAPIKDLLKMQVWQIARWRNELAAAQGLIAPIPQNSIDKEPSAELRPDQKDSDSLPDYQQLDAALAIYVEQDLGIDGLRAAGFDEAFIARLVRLVDSAEYKRRQYPPGTKVSRRAFGKDRRLPITSAWRENA